MTVSLPAMHERSCQQNRNDGPAASSSTSSNSMPLQICWSVMPQELCNCTNDLGKVREIITILLFSGLALTFKVCRFLNIIITAHRSHWLNLMKLKSPCDHLEKPEGFNPCAEENLLMVKIPPTAHLLGSSYGQLAYRTGKLLIKGYEINYFLGHKSNGMSSVVLFCFFFQKCIVY